MGFTREQLELYRDATVPDLIGAECRLLFVGINPGLWTAATGTHFCHPSNRFYPALRMGGLIDFEVDADQGMTDRQREAFVARGMGITNLVERATVRASELTGSELVEGAERLEERVAATRAAVLAVAGITAYRTAFGNMSAVLGPQPDDIGTARTWVVPNPSGLNAHETIATLAEWYRRVAVAAGII